MYITREAATQEIPVLIGTPDKDHYYMIICPVDSSLQCNDVIAHADKYAIFRTQICSDFLPLSMHLHCRLIT